MFGVPLYQFGSIFTIVPAPGARYGCDCSTSRPWSTLAPMMFAPAAYGFTYPLAAVAAALGFAAPVVETPCWPVAGVDPRRGFPDRVDHVPVCERDRDELLSVRELEPCLVAAADHL